MYAHCWRMSTNIRVQATKPDSGERRCSRCFYCIGARQDTGRYVLFSWIYNSSDDFPDAHGDVLRGLQVVETACGIANSLMGEKIEVSRDMDTETRRLPLGVCAR